MLNPDFIIRGEKRNYEVPGDVSLGEYLINCIKRRNGNDIFAIDGVTGKVLTCEELLDQIFKTVTVLRNLGVKSGDTVTLISENSLKYCSTLLALYYMGAPANLINHVYTAGELRRALTATKPKLIIASKSVYKTLYQLDDESVSNIIVLLENISMKEIRIRKGVKVVVLDQLLSKTHMNIEKVPPGDITDKNHMVFILLSSGTTGLPKCLMITHENFINAVVFLNGPKYLNINSKDTTIAVLPFCHIYGVSLINIAATFSIKLIVFSSFIPDLYLKSIEKYSVSLIWGVPTILSFLTKHLSTGKYDLSSITCITCSGGHLTTQIQNEIFIMHPQIHIVQIYGLSELSGAATIRSCHDFNKLESVGKLSPNLEAIIWDSELSKNVGPLETGELCFRGPMLMKGYIDEVRKPFDDIGFYHTGDLGYYNEDGYFYLIGRCKEMIKYKGYQVAPAEIEEVITSHSAIVECAVIGVPNERVGQLPAAFVVLHLEANITEQDIIQYVSERISIHKQLHGGVKFIKTIPKSTTGKILRDKLVELYNSS